MSFNTRGSGLSLKLSDSLRTAIGDQTKAFERLASGSRLNRPSDDPAGAAVVAQLDAVTVTTRKAAENISYLTSMLDTTDATLAQLGDITIRMQELATQSANGTLADSDRAALQQEFDSLQQEANRIASNTTFNGRQLLNGSDTTAQTGPSSTDTLTVGSPNVASLISGLSSQNISSQASAQSALTSVQELTDQLAALRGSNGAAQARLSSTSNSLSASELGTIQAASAIRDADIAQEFAFGLAARIRTEQTTALIAQVNQNRSMVLRLLG